MNNITHVLKCMWSRSRTCTPSQSYACSIYLYARTLYVQLLIESSLILQANCQPANTQPSAIVSPE